MGTGAKPGRKRGSSHYHQDNPHNGQGSHMRVGATSLLERDPGLADAIVASVESGLFDNQIALKHGIHPLTLKRWLDKGLAEDAVEPFLSFAQNYLQKQADIEAEAVEKIKAAAEPANSKEENQCRGDWRALAWWLERWRPLRWGQNAAGLGARDTYQLPTVQSRQKRAEDVFRNPTPEMLRAIEAAGKVLVDKTAVVETTGEEAKPPA